MQYHNIQELKELIAAKLTPEELIDLLGLSMHDLVDALEPAITQYQDELEDAVR